MIGEPRAIHSEKATVPPRGERVARAVETLQRDRGLTLSEIAHQAGVEKRDLQRLLHRRQCGHRLEDALAGWAGWDLTIAIMTPVHGADPLTSLEREVEERLRGAAQIHERVERYRAALQGAGSGRVGLARALALEGPSGDSDAAAPSPA